jgi:hypothetical protein
MGVGASVVPAIDARVEKCMRQLSRECPLHLATFSVKILLFV